MRRYQDWSSLRSECTRSIINAGHCSVVSRPKERLFRSAQLIRDENESIVGVAKPGLAVKRRSDPVVPGNLDRAVLSSEC